MERVHQVVLKNIFDFVPYFFLGEYRWGRSFESWVEGVVRMGWRVAGGLGAENFGFFRNFCMCSKCMEMMYNG